MAFLFDRLPKAFTGSELCFAGTCQIAESGGSLENLLIKTETSQTDIPQHPPWMSKQVWFCLEKNVKAALQRARVTSLNDQFQPQKL